MKKLIAYSSVAHMGFVTLGIFFSKYSRTSWSNNPNDISRYYFSSIIFSIGSIYNRYKTKRIDFFGGLNIKLPKFSVVFLIFTLGSIGLPGTSGFVGEYLTLLAVYSKNTMVAFISTLGVILSASYMLKLYKRVSLVA